MFSEGGGGGGDVDDSYGPLGCGGGVVDHLPLVQVLVPREHPRHGVGKPWGASEAEGLVKHGSCGNLLDY